jgi:CMP-N,N'-diacetyllegionaminic acid synthase
MSRVCTICARGGSKGVRGKNLREMHGKPLLAYTVEQAKASGLFDVVAVSSDSSQILEIANRFGADLLIERPAELATDTAAKLPVIRHAVAEAERQSGRTFGTLVDLDATSPLRNVDDIRAAVALLEDTGSGNVITAMPARRSPYFNLVELNDRGQVVLSKPVATPFVRRQDAPLCFDMNASIYVWRRDTLFVMPEERSIDIDSELDFQFVEFLIAQRAGAVK